MENMNKKVGQGKSPKQYEDSSRLAWYSVIGMIILLIFVYYVDAIIVLKLEV